MVSEVLEEELMPSGIYERTKPKSKKQMKQCRKLGLNNKGVKRGPKTENQIQTSRNNMRKVGLSNKNRPTTRAQFKARQAKRIDKIVKHHNDLCGGKVNPDDVTFMNYGEHSRFHRKLEVKNGTHHWLKENRRRRIGKSQMQKVW